MLVTKSSVRFPQFTPALMALLNALYAADLGRLDGQPDDLVITSGNDSTHSAHSRHYTGEALDIRSKTFANSAAKERFRKALESNLGPKFRVLLEYPGTVQEHFHAQVKKGTTYP